jgi:hypothetical protein
MRCMPGDDVPGVLRARARALRAVRHSTLPAPQLPLVPGLGLPPVRAGAILQLPPVSPTGDLGYCEFYGLVKIQRNVC